MASSTMVARARRFLNTHNELRFGRTAAAEVVEYLRDGEVHSAFVVAVLEYYETNVRDGGIPMLSKGEWARRLGMNPHTLRDHWERLRRWQIDGQYVFLEGKHALRKGTWIEDMGAGAARQITLPGIGLRTADMPPMSLRSWLAVVESTRESARVMAATVQHAAQAVEEDVASTAEDRARAREGRLSTINPAGQLPLRIVTGAGGR